MTLPMIRDEGPALASRLPFHWRADRHSLTALSGQVGAFARTGVGAAGDRTGRLRLCAQHIERWESHSLNGVLTAALLLERARTNVCRQSENLGTTWVAIGAPTRVADALTIGPVTFDLVTDTSAAVLQGHSQVLTGLSGNAVKGLDVAVVRGSSTTSVIRWRDTTAAADRVLGVLTWTGAGLPSLAMTTGTFLGSLPLGDGAYLLKFQTTSVTAANANQVELYPATTSGLAVSNTGSLYWGSVQVENAPSCGSRVLTTTAAATLQTESLPYPWDVPPQACTLYVRLVELGTRLSSLGVVDVGGDGSSPRLYLDSTGTTYRITHENGTGSVTASATGPPAFGADVELRAVLRTDGSVLLGQSINGAAETVSAASAALPLATAWASPDLSCLAALHGLVTVQVRFGEWSLVQMRGTF